MLSLQTLKYSIPMIYHKEANLNKANYSEQVFHIYKYDPSSITAFLCIFNCKFLPVSFCNTQKDKLKSEDVLWTRANSKTSKQAPGSVWYLTDFSKKGLSFMLTTCLSLQVCLTNTTHHTSLNQPFPSCSFTIYIAYTLLFNFCMMFNCTHKDCLQPAVNTQSEQFIFLFKQCIYLLLLQKFYLTYS